METNGKQLLKMSQGLFKYTVMFFGICNSPATFQAMMDDIFCDMKTKGWIIIYMNNIFIFTKELEQMFNIPSRHCNGYKKTISS
jgi:hypothetical protein